MSKKMAKNYMERIFGVGAFERKVPGIGPGEEADEDREAEVAKEPQRGLSLIEAMGLQEQGVDAAFDKDFSLLE